MIGLLVAVLVVAVTITALGVVLFALAKPDVNSARRREIALLIITVGVTLGTADVLGVFVHEVVHQETTELLQSQTREILGELAKSFDSRDEPGRIQVLAPASGHDDIARETVQSLLSPSLYYTDWRADVTLSYLPASPGSAEPKFLRLMARVEVTVRNPTDSTAVYPLRITAFDLRAPAEAEQQTTVVSVSFTPLSKEGKELADQAQVLGPDILRPHNNREQREVTVFREFSIKPMEAAKLVFVEEGYEPIADGNFTLQTVHRAVNMTLQVSFPDDRFEKSVYYFHAKANNRRVCVDESTGNSITAHILGGILPYQGIQCTWTRKAA